ncbi:hypothetical protein ACFPZ0_11685 [Streptomonospora nanhaiensis]|uniref:Mce-associated membrane protein n=1 Tax=Streptomonospora nanhaiensis TaxID=1323731 RepID=A0A853BP60_9ACTN|nr:hypothetical protein [Streptomonospora nanhaiensis]MBV2366088.1 hypothetical protein [Streptomonospora nanhaiensis]MBX9388878.1 hypothetical protein [Streptomonospora nanhaiensis]NYI96564.1 hypothetical protein [Streptomonospora nanhaiensis]
MRDSLFPQRTTTVFMVTIAVLIGALVALALAMMDGGSPGPAEGASDRSGYPPFGEALPVDEADYAAAAEVALAHTEGYGTYTPGQSAEDHLAAVREAAPLADVPEGVDLAGATAAHTALEDLGAATQGAAQVARIEYLGAESMELSVDVTAVPEEGPAEAEDVDLGRYTVLLMREDDAWVVTSAVPEAPEGGGPGGGPTGDNEPADL